MAADLPRPATTTSAAPTLARRDCPVHPVQQIGEDEGFGHPVIGAGRAGGRPHLVIEGGQEQHHGRAAKSPAYFQVSSARARFAKAADRQSRRPMLAFTFDPAIRD